MKKILPFLTIFCLPVLALAQTAKTILADIRDILNVAIPVLMVLGVVYFIWGVIEFMTAKDEEKRKEGRSKIRDRHEEGIYHTAREASERVQG